MMQRLLLAWLLAVPAAAAPAAAPVSVAGAPVAAAEGFLDPKSLAWVIAFPKPPAPGSPTDLSDLDMVKAWQARRTPAECARARSEEAPTFENLFGAVSPLPSPLPPRAALLIGAVKADAGAATGLLKAREKRARPFLRDASIVPCIEKPKGTSYPSGHATLARLWARVLADLVPARQNAFEARAEEAGLDRVIAGVHHPSDVEAGRKLADGLHEELLQSPAYRAALDAVRAELPHLGTVPEPSLR